MRKIFLFLPFLLSSSCNNPCKGPDVVPLNSLSQDVRDYGIFQVGTYWVYKNDSTFAIDSIAVIATKTDTLPMDKDCEGVYITI